jgi:hypothetical protein
VNGNSRSPEEEAADNLIESVFKDVIAESHVKSADDVVARALLSFLVRAANSWRSIRTLRNNTIDEEGFLIDAGTILRAMYDAYFQAEYLISKTDQRILRANDYFDFEHVERHKFVERVLKHNNWISERLSSSPKRAAGEIENKKQFDRVKSRFGKGKKLSDATRNHWYPGNLSDIATALNKSDEYDTFLAAFNGSVHSSAMTMRFGPSVSAQNVLTMASTITAKVAQLSVTYNGINLSSTHQKLLSVLTSPAGESFR